MLNAISQYLVEDKDKKKMIDAMINPPMAFYKKRHSLHALNPSYDEELNLHAPDIKMDTADFSEDLTCEIEEPSTKFCPKCHKKYPENENFCFDCLVALKPLSDKIPVTDIKTKPVFQYRGKNDYDDFESILTPENLDLINSFKISAKGYDSIIKNIKRTALKNMDKLIKDNYVDMKDLSVYEHVLLFTKSFVKVGFKSYGQELGYFEFDRIMIDDRQDDILLTTTLIHELSHFILKEILTEVLCKLLDCSKNIRMECVVDYILMYSNFTRLIDEYCAHCCEGRFTLYGYQDYSSFLNIIASMDGEMSRDEIEITKSIGNTFANSIKDILESVIDRSILKRIKMDFRNHHYEKPNYEMLKLENCEMLTSEGFLKSIWLILSEGFENAMNKSEKLEDYYKGVI